MASKPANAKQKRFFPSITEWAINGGMALLYGHEWDKPFHIHHVLGKSAKNNKVHIGHDFLLPVPIELHDPNLKHEYHVGHCKNAFTAKFGKQVFLYNKMYDDMNRHGYELPDREIFEAIVSTNA